MDQFQYYNQSYPTKGNNSRVYINPNFNRNASHTAPIVSNSNVYFNPSFSNQIGAQHQVTHSVFDRNEVARPRIHINPNFIKQNQNLPSNVTISNTVSSYSMVNAVGSNPKPAQKIQTEIQSESQTPVSKSRYSLVRKKENNVLSPNTKVVANTVKVNKYKVVSLNTVKMNIATEKLTVKKIEVPVNKNVLKSKYKIRSKLTTVINSQNSRFKFIKRNSASILNLSSKTNVIRRASLTINKTSLNANTPAKRIVKGALKKNNIPCPLFKKYGKCLRLSRGKCDFLHDKKHVSICRKFMKGICHEERCLLSHDLTNNKMPTCYFYLQGMCTKETCPYLHVKLNEKTKICQDFLKGYCEKGDTCVHRHVNVKRASKSATTKQNTQTTTNKRSERLRGKRKSIIDAENRKKKAKDTRQNDEDGRYFKDATIEEPDEEYSLIKPTRCKLGTLPSFIQL